MILTERTRARPPPAVLGSRLVDRLADDRAGHADATSRPASAARSAKRCRHHREAITGTRSRRAPPRARRRRPRERAVASDLGDDEGGHARRRRTDGTTSRSRGPSPRSQPRTADLAVRGVETDGDRAASRPPYAAHEGRIFERRGTEHDTSHARVEQRAAAASSRTPPPGLHRHVDRGGDGRDHRPVRPDHPVRAASRSTTWIQGAPAAREGHGLRRPDRRRTRSRGRSRPGTGGRSGRPAHR